MKIYTEVNYIWKDDKLVQTDSKSFDYEGEVDQCHTKKAWGVNVPHAHGGEAGKVTDEINKQSENATDWAKRNNMDKPGGSVKSQITDPVKVWSQKLEHHVWGNKYPGQGITPSSDASDNAALDELYRSSRRGFQGVGKYAKGESEDMRREPYAMNTKTLLTQGQKAKKVS